MTKSMRLLFLITVLLAGGCAELPLKNWSHEDSNCVVIDKFDAHAYSKSQANKLLAKTLQGEKSNRIIYSDDIENTEPYSQFSIAFDKQPKANWPVQRMSDSHIIECHFSSPRRPPRSPFIARRPVDPHIYTGFLLFCPDIK